jgi:hypothetical protein
MSFKVVAMMFLFSLSPYILNQSELCLLFVSHFWFLNCCWPVSFSKF